MSNCYLCGVRDNHLSYCPKYIDTSPQKAITSICDYEGYFIVRCDDDQNWRVTRLIKGDVIPKWATHGWCLSDHDKSSSSKLSLKELVDAWNNHCAPWELKTRNLRPGQESNWERPILVFCVSKV